MIQIKRAYEPMAKKDGYRVLVDRLWPRGIKKEDLPFDEWLKDLAPSTELRKEFGHDHKHWKSFISAYKKELRAEKSRALIEKLAKEGSKKTVTLLYGAHDEEHNNAVVLKQVLEKEIEKSKH